jgi:3-phenylpropionate/trans-cinnamate dioxygenase ferredoxin reductase subunit
MSNPHIVIVGAGPAGGTAVKALRTEGFGGRLTLLGSENHRPYMRPPLSKQYLRGETDRESVFLETETWYRDNEVELRSGTTVSALDAPGHTLLIAGEPPLTFDSLLLATGSTPRRPSIEGAGLSGVHYLRVLEDSGALHDQLAGGGKRLVIIGSGWIGLEVAASARALGNDVTVLTRSALPVENALGPELGAFFAELHSANGVTLRPSVRVNAITTDFGVASGVLLSTGEVVPADLVLVAIGADPNVGLAETAGLRVDNGVLVDERLATSAPDVFAAGDIANAFHPLGGVRIRNEHVSNALKGGTAAAKIMLGQDLTYDDLPTFISEQFDVTLSFAGFAPLMVDADVVYRGDPASHEFSAFWLANGRPVAGAHVNVADPGKAMQGVIRRGDTVDPARLADSSIPLEEV